MCRFKKKHQKQILPLFLLAPPYPSLYGGEYIQPPRAAHQWIAEGTEYRGWEKSMGEVTYG